MEIDIFGKEGCNKCETAKERFEEFLADKSLAKKVPLRYFDMETVDGIAEGAFNDVLDIPTIIIKDMDKRVVRWDGSVPEVGEMESTLAKMMG